MLIGQYDSKVDSKGRSALPKKFREILGDRVIITFGFESSLILVSEASWKTLLSGTEGRPFIEYETRDTQRFLLGGAASIELDSKGRFILPSYLRQFGKIGNEIIFLGLSTYVEIWDRDAWSKYSEYLEKNIERISQKLVVVEKEDKK